MKMNGWFRKWILKDMSKDNETNRTALMVRVLSLIMSFYYIAEAILFFAAGVPDMGTLSVVFAACFTGILFLTYGSRQRLALDFLIVMIMLWAVIIITAAGWALGAQNFLLVLLMLLFLASYVRLPGKFAAAALFCAVRILLYFYAASHVPLKSMPGWFYSINSITHSIVIFTAATALVTMASQHTIETERKLMETNKKVRVSACHDSLTNLMNRRACYEEFERNLETWTSGAISIAMGDIDFFKQLNNSYGHDAGDAVLVHLAELFQETVRDKGYCARWGGEEFLFVFYGRNGDDSYILLEDLRRKIAAEPVEFAGKKLCITMTFGLEEYSFGRPMDVTIKRADVKLYQGKNTGRNRVVY
jgi:diguanylate cyclase (GGDEF)-like protein